MSFDLSTLGKRIKHCREFRGLKQKDLAKRLGIEPSAMSNYENNDSANPSYDFIVRLSEALEIAPGYFFENLNVVDYINMEGYLEYVIYLSEFPEDLRIHYCEILHHIHNQNVVDKAVASNSILKRIKDRAELSANTDEKTRLIKSSLA